MFSGFGLTELVIILLIVIIFFGVGRLPEIGSGLGKAIKSFKKAASEEEAGTKPKEEEERPKKDKNA